MPNPKRQPWHPTILDAAGQPLEAADAYAVKAWEKGEAGPEQQKRAFALVMRAAGLRDEPFVADNPRVTDYRLGRQSVGRQIAALLQWRPPKGV
jgi:hypothetical protein